MRAKRYLDRIERLYEFAETMVVEYSGYLDNEVLLKAFQLLRQKYPVLRAFIVKDAHGDLLCCDNDLQSNVVVRNGDENTLNALSSADWDSSRGVIQLLHIRGNQQGFVGFRIDHRIADGAPLFTFWTELWALYTRILSKQDLVFEVSNTLPTPPTELLEERWAGAVPELELGAMPTDNELCGTVSFRLRLAETATARLIEFARTNTSTVGTVLNGSILAATRRSASIPTGQYESAVVLSTVDLRKYATPPVHATETTLFQARSRVKVSTHGTAMEIGRRVWSRVASQIADRRLEMIWEELPARPEFFHIINNVGAVPDLSTPAGICIREYIMSFANSNTISNMIAHQCYTILGCLNVYGFYPSKYFSINDARHMMDCIVDELCVMVGFEESEADVIACY